VATGRPTELDTEEPMRVAEAVRLMKVRHCVITSVNRDELKDKGSVIWAATIREVKKLNPDTTIEVLIPDFRSDWDALKRVVDEQPDVISHNMETVERLYRRVRPQAKYERSMEQLLRTKEMGVRTKSGFMVGLGETDEEVYKLMHDLHNVKLDVLTIGQYLQPTAMHLQVEDFITPEKFKEFETEGYKIGFDYVESGPLVRSSYHSERHIGRKKGA
jgi:lipoic acid synthetase